MSKTRINVKGDARTLASLPEETRSQQLPMSVVFNVHITLFRIEGGAAFHFMLVLALNPRIVLLINLLVSLFSDLLFRGCFICGSVISVLKQLSPRKY